eukprot:CAMPEP_0201908126 /NCGR_PEP_ID=MMETSP0903-20130614/329_1 /ASSEMBLY_ACC=CAM_ASM_000552 /TAXON_ID=420261 /ORGANISM="Thalassiosira antarctica, Strain CCMP982" /LENGTH=146 /DNA_ID=CAMNT_0048442395 /DNA_START=54 /DNA_END=492 /DNA_ORIENTATION=-
MAARGAGPPNKPPCPRSIRLAVGAISHRESILLTNAICEQCPGDSRASQSDFVQPPTCAPSSPAPASYMRPTKPIPIDDKWSSLDAASAILAADIILASTPQWQQPPTPSTSTKSVSTTATPAPATETHASAATMKACSLQPPSLP